MLAIFPFTTTESINLESQNQAKNIKFAPGVHELWSDKQTNGDYNFVYKYKWDGKGKYSSVI